MQAQVNDLGPYRDFLETFLKDDYDCLFFGEKEVKGRQLMMRHDIDFDTGFALDVATIESELGVKATYFFLLRSNFYNAFSSQDFDNISRIRDMGHCITIHFDPLLYEDFHEGLRQEVAIFEKLFDKKVEVISLHRPNDFFQNYDSPIMGIEHTYQSRYFRDIKYFSDSTGQWRFGHPHDSEAFHNGEALHILTHPVWWMVPGVSNHEKLKVYYKRRTQGLKTEFFNNCKPFREIYESL